VLSALEDRISLPDINPAYYHTAALSASIWFLYIESLTIKIVLVAFILLTDWLDGATARREPLRLHYGRGDRSRLGGAPFFSER
jgi:hypothetical protein